MRRKRKTETLEGLCQFIHGGGRALKSLSLSHVCHADLRACVTSFDVLWRHSMTSTKVSFLFISPLASPKSGEPKTGSFFDLRSPQSRAGKSATAAKCALWKEVKKKQSKLKKKSFYRTRQGIWAIEITYDDVLCCSTKKKSSKRNLTLTKLL